MPKQQIDSEKVRPVAAYSTGWKVSNGHLVMLAGQVATDTEGRTVGGDDVKAQARQVYENVKAALEAAGAGMEDVIRLTVYLTDRANFPGSAEVRQAYFSPPYPASTLLIVSGLANPEWLIEIDAVAFVEDGTP